MERGQIGKASDAKPGDWIEIKSARPGAKREHPRIDLGFHYFDVVRGSGKSGQLTNPSVLLAFHGSISGHTIIKKTGSDFDHQ